MAVFVRQSFTNVHFISCSSRFGERVEIGIIARRCVRPRIGASDNTDRKTSLKMISGEANREERV